MSAKWAVLARLCALAVDLTSARYPCTMSAFVRASLLGLVLLPCAVHAQPGDPDLLRDVDPMIGTQRMGHVYPGATAPFGMVQVSPDTDTLPLSK